MYKRQAEELGRAMDLAAQSGVVEDVAAQSMEELGGEMGQISDALTQVCLLYTSRCV